jgi:hypothetical protein
MPTRAKSTKPTSAKLDPAAEIATFGKKQAEALGAMQRELYGVIEQANGDWLARVERERALASELVTRFSTAKSLPEITNVCQEWMARRTKMMVEDNRILFANSQKFMNAASRLFSNGLAQPQRLS